MDNAGLAFVRDNGALPVTFQPTNDLQPPGWGNNPNNPNTAINIDNVQSHLAPLANVGALSIQNSVGHREGGLIYDVVPSPSGTSPPIFQAREDLSCLKEYCIGQQRSFSLVLSDRSNRPSIIVERPNDFCRFCCGSLHYGGDAFVRLAEGGTRLGKISMHFNFYTPSFSIYDDMGIKRMTIQGPSCSSRYPYCAYGCGNDAKFIVSSDSGTLAMIHQRYLNSDQSGVEFSSPNVDPRDKALILASLFFIKISLFEWGNICSCKRGCTGIEVAAILIIIIYFILLVVNGPPS